MLEQDVDSLGVQYELILAIVEELGSEELSGEAVEDSLAALASYGQKLLRLGRFGSCFFVDLLAFLGEGRLTE
jgi:hypothetical protein